MPSMVVEKCDRTGTKVLVKCEGRANQYTVVSRKKQLELQISLFHGASRILHRWRVAVKKLRPIIRRGVPEDHQAAETRSVPDNNQKTRRAGFSCKLLYRGKAGSRGVRKCRGRFDDHFPAVISPRMDNHCTKMDFNMWSMLSSGTRLGRRAHLPRGVRARHSQRHGPAEKEAERS